MLEDFSTDEIIALFPYLNRSTQDLLFQYEPRVLEAYLRNWLREAREMKRKEAAKVLNG